MDINKDIIEISFILISEKIKRCKPLLLNLKSLEINRSTKKLFEMPDKSIIDIVVDEYKSGGEYADVTSKGNAVTIKYKAPDMAEYDPICYLPVFC